MRKTPEPVIRSGYVIPVAGVVAAIAITTTLDATGLTAFSALPLFPLMGLFWYLEKMSRRELGLVSARPSHFVLAALHPVLVIGIIALICAATGATDITHTDWKKTALNGLLMAVSTIVMATITEEGFFRGWLWASLKSRGMSQRQVLLWTSVAFSAWHISAVTLQTGFDLPARQIPVFLVNAAVLGATWGILRSISGSVIVSSVSHGVWNGLAYALFGYGTKVGALGVADTALYGPEVGIIGLTANVLFLMLLMNLASRRKHLATGGQPTEVQY